MFTVPPAGGMYVASQTDTVRAVIVPPGQVSGLAQLRCVPTFRSAPPRSVTAVGALVDLIGNWSRARLVGDPFAAYRQRDVQLALTRHLFAGLGGDVWKASELEFERKHDLQLLARAVATTGGNARLVRSLCSTAFQHSAVNLRCNASDFFAARYGDSSSARSDGSRN